jgi:hypothetical protein
VLSPTVRSVTEQELAFIAGLDQGQHQDAHLEALRKVIFEQNGSLVRDQYWFPYEVIELGAHSLTPGHEREFAICTLLVIGSVRTGFDSATNLPSKFNDRAAQYDALPPSLREEVLAAYQAAGC